MKRIQFFLEQLIDLGVSLWVEDGRLKFKAPSGVMSEKIKVEISNNKVDIIDYLIANKSSNTDSYFDNAIQPLTNKKNCPMSYAQWRLWFLSQLDQENAVYNISFARRLSGHLDISILSLCINEIIKRHDVLRTTFKDEDNSPVQMVSTSFDAGLIEENVEKIFLNETKKISEKILQEKLEEESNWNFDLGKGPIFRAKLFKLSEQEHILSFTMHHMVSDGWSLGILARELSELYTAYVQGEESPLDDLPIQYSDYSHWQREWLRGEVLEKQIGYWREQLSGLTPLLELPTDRPRPLIQTYNGATKRFEIPSLLLDKLRDITHDSNSTLFMSLLGVFKVLLWRYSGQEDIAVGTPIANRNRPELEGLIGFFVTFGSVLAKTSNQE